MVLPYRGFPSWCCNHPNPVSWFASPFLKDDSLYAMFLPGVSNVYLKCS